MLSQVSEVKAPAAPKMKYPIIDKSQWGPPTWTVLQNTVASSFPDTPSRSDRMEWGRWLKFMVKNLPCKQECVPHAYEYMKNHPPNLSDRKSFFRWVVDFHNHVNEITGKDERKKSDELLDDSVRVDSSSNNNCPSCSNTSNTDQKSDNADAVGTTDSTDNIEAKDSETIHEPSLKEKIEAFKQTTRQIVEEECKREGIPAPQVLFASCPDGSNTSCIVGGKTIYFDPKKFSIKTIFHELKHYVDAAKGKQIDDSQNPEADQYADQQLDLHFTADQIEKQEGEPLPAVHDKKYRGKKNKVVHATPLQMVMPNPDANVRQVVSSVYGAAPAAAAVPFEDMPQFRQALNEVEKQEMMEHAVEHHRNNKEGILSHLDPIYSWPAGMMGLKPQDLNLIHTPRILAAIGLVLFDSYLNPVASGSVSLVFGLVLMLLPLLLKERLPVRDLQLLAAVGAMFFWDTTKYLNPKRMYDLKKEFDKVKKAVDEKDFTWRKLVETPGQYVKQCEWTEYQAKRPVVIAPPMTPEEIRKHRLIHGAKVSNYKQFPNSFHHMHSPALEGAAFATEGIPMTTSNALYTERPLVGGNYGPSRGNSNVIDLPPYNPGYY